MGWLAIAKTNELTDGFYKINTKLSFLYFFLISEFSLSSVHVHVPIRNVLGFQFCLCKTSFSFFFILESLSNFEKKANMINLWTRKFNFWVNSTKYEIFVLLAMFVKQKGMTLNSDSASISPPRSIQYTYTWVDQQTVWKMPDNAKGHYTVPFS